MLQISQPFSSPGPTRMSHRKRNLRRRVRKPAPEQRRHRLWIEPDLLRSRRRCCVRRDCARSFADPPNLDVPAWS